METLAIVAFIHIWFISGLITMGCNYAYFQEKFSYIADDARKHDSYMAITLIPLGLFGLFICHVTFKGHWNYGWRVPFTIKREHK